MPMPAPFSPTARKSIQNQRSEQKLECGLFPNPSGFGLINPHNQPGAEDPRFGAKRREPWERRSGTAKRKTP